MAIRTTTYDYEQSSEGGRERHIIIPYARLTDATPTLHDPAEVICALPGSSITGTVITLDAIDSVAVINVADGAVYRHNVRNVATYNAQAEATWQALNIGDMVYYDNSATMPAGVYLSVSPLDNLGVANTPFGHIIALQDQTAADFPVGDTQAGISDAFAIVQL